MRILLTGGGGRLGAELRALLPGVVAPSSRELDVTADAQVQAVVQREAPDLIVHAAAYTDVGGAETQREACWQVNVEGTRAVARAANEVGARLLHISTDYVFSGETGDYREDDPPGPVVNYYALTKLVAEEAARTARHRLILRTSFRPREFQYPVAFSDVYTSQDYVDIIAPLVAQVVRHAPEIPYDLLHVATERKSVYDLARRRRPDVREGRRAEARVVLPADVSLNTERWTALRAGWESPA
ncbi:NAD(P)-dependent oxidoreductase [Deinococcus sp. MIMF12]|uniref:dTDP-4-dehydrorhamnose reductase n=1 Tax=Deinococcus rhizophilus TaxID=3049544 RepID=A0ABT7JEK3_9DEIO|nr:NAD(P)-dependent oxidoreductase [Deinococcus rhizophilus]MDL2342992.1 NAD(P)-dependent oxidoreductase [Deinococcus rhizophilus]